MAGPTRTLLRVEFSSRVFDAPSVSNPPNNTKSRSREARATLGLVMRSLQKIGEDRTMRPKNRKKNRIMRRKYGLAYTALLGTALSATGSVAVMAQTPDITAQLKAQQQQIQELQRQLQSMQKQV